MNPIKPLQNNRRFIWAIVTIVVVLGGLATYIYYSTNQDSLINFNFLRPKNMNTSNYEILETRDFSCPGMEGFTFKYPVFKGWEEVEIVKDEGYCSMFAVYEGEREELIRFYPNYKDEKLENFSLENIKKNPHGISYIYGDHSLDFVFGEDAGGNLSGLTISSLKEEYMIYYPLDQFFQTVIESFKLIKISQSQALEIAHQDAEKAYEDLSKFNVIAILQNDGWHVDYDLKIITPGGGPHYVINVQTGEIVSKRYEK